MAQESQEHKTFAKDLFDLLRHQPDVQCVTGAMMLMHGAQKGASKEENEKYQEKTQAVSQTAIKHDHHNCF